MKALLLHPEFSSLGFWNYKEVCHLMGAKYPASPLGLITMAALQALFANDQLHFHINNAVNIGITGDEIHEALAHAGVYAGIAGWRNAANVARDIFLQRGIVQPH